MTWACYYYSQDLMIRINRIFYYKKQSINYG